MNTDTTVKALYKVLDENRTQGVWITERNVISKDVSKRSIADNGKLEIAKCYPTIEGNSYENRHLNAEVAKAFEEQPELIERVITSEQCRINAQYTTLAINNLSKIADVLENIAKMDNKDFANSFHTKGETAKQIMFIGKLAKEALSLIS